MKICSAQNIGKALISRKKHPGPISVPFQTNFPWAGTMQTLIFLLSIFLVGPTGSYLPDVPVSLLHASHIIHFVLAQGTS